MPNDFIIQKIWAKLFLVYLAVNTVTPRFLGVDIDGVFFLSIGRIAFSLFIIWFFLYAIISDRTLVKLPTSLSRIDWAVMSGLVVFVLFSILSAFKSEVPFVSAKRVFSEGYIAGVIVFGVWLIAAKNTSERHAFRVIMSICLWVVVIFGLFDYLSGNGLLSSLRSAVHEEMFIGFTETKVRSGYLRIQSVMDNPLTYGTFLLVAYAITRGAPTMKHRWFPVWRTFGVILIYTSLLLTFSRFVWGLALLLIAIIVVQEKCRGRIVFVGAVLFAVLVMAPSLITLQKGLSGSLETTSTGSLETVVSNIIQSKEYLVERSTSYRLATIRAGLESFTRNPLLGVGPGNFSTEVVGDYYSNRMVFFHHENFLVTLLAEAGGAAFFGFIVFMSAVFAAGFQAYKMLGFNKELFSNLIGLGIFNISFLFLDTLSFNQLSLIFWIVCGNILSMYRQTINPVFNK